jgi:hypothetical protein
VKRRRRWVWVAAVMALVVLALLTPAGEDPDATLALRRYLANMGFAVAEGERMPPSEGTFILLNDLRGRAEAQGVVDWVAAGGNLVVADPEAVIVELVGAAPGGPIGFTGTAELEPGCVAPVAVGVGRVVARVSDIGLEAIDPAFVSCFPTGDAAFLLTRRYGEGTVTLLGGASPFTNALLIEQDNAVLAVQLADTGREISFGVPTSGDTAAGGLWDALPDSGQTSVVAICVAAVAFALVRARRLGRPVVEEPIAPIPGSELVRAAARMYRRARAVGYSARLMRQAVAARLSSRLGVARGGAELSRAVARASALAEHEVAEILDGPEPSTDEELIRVGRELEELAARAEARSR